MDIIVTTPKRQMVTAAHEAEQAKKHGGYYFRRLASRPKGLQEGSKVFYVEDGYIRGFATVCKLVNLPEGKKCEVSWYPWAAGFYIYMNADSWKWIKPIPMEGFQGYRYFTPPEDMEIVGDWKDPKPEKGERDDAT